ncbi:ATP-binding protein [Dethiobacter alkaliphilus]|uniref:histidine kinase n=1 Tax=Dethiobacter alkaliphilus AHT 1 TaxID=555088 RepID=C0GIJ9_DETAL|nr:sensor histidine kinase [Dethiobacter alkaliphilus]EEG76860.1 signal transduction histidine kinase regulating citrate/malate metabolism [Dethiobacter alkaliphilus AHT 1]
MGLPRQLPLRWKITLLSFGLIALAVLIGGMILIENFSATLEDEIGSRAMAVARTVAQIEEIQNNVGTPGGDADIQPVAERIRLATNVEYIVVLDMDRTRYSHPLQDRIGQQFEGGDEGPAFADHEYISRAAGIMGPSVRAFVPIRVDEGTRQVGVVVVGILTPTVTGLLSDIRTTFYFSLLFALIVGLAGSIYLADNIKRTMHNMEPAEMARLMEERVSVFHAIGEGIIAIDREMNITVINEEARRILHLDGEYIGRPVLEAIPDSHLRRTVETGTSEYNQERSINGTAILVSRIPIVVNGEIVGAVATFKDKSELHTLAEELTGVKKFIEALRVQNHEHANKLHTIAGLIQLKQYDEAIDYIFEVTAEQEELTLFLTKNIKDYSVAGLIFGKYSRAKELRIEMSIDPQTHLNELPAGLDSSTAVIIIGNLLENAMDAVSGLPQEKRKIEILVRNLPEHFLIRVKDLGVGIAPEHLSEIFKPGFSTKAKENRGVGLSLVYQQVMNAGGEIRVESEQDQFTNIEIRIPNERRSTYEGN